MSAVVKGRRRYESTLRREQAEATRARILDAALERFRHDGYRATTVRAIADQAAVSVQTLYQAWGSKAALVEGLIRRVKDEIDLPFLFAEMERGPHDPATLLRRSAHVTRRYSEAGWEVLDLVREVAEREPGVAGPWEETEAQRYRGQRQVVDWIAAGAGLGPGVDAEWAADTLWTLSAHDVYRLLTRDRGYTPAKYEDWLFRTSCELLLGDRARP